jgi:hypothetical protein
LASLESEVINYFHTAQLGFFQETNQLYQNCPEAYSNHQCLEAVLKFSPGNQLAADNENGNGIGVVIQELF